MPFKQNLAYLGKDKKIQTSQRNVEETIQTKPKNKQKTKKAKVPTQADNDKTIVTFMWISHTHSQECKFSKNRNGIKNLLPLFLRSQ